MFLTTFWLWWRQLSRYHGPLYYFLRDGLYFITEFFLLHGGLMYRIVPDDPESEDYKIWHTRGIGASAAEVVMNGKNKYRETEYDLWAYITKRQEKPPQTAPMLAGLEAEPEIAKAWEKYIGRPGESINVIDGEYDFLRAQIDWIDWDGEFSCDFKYSYGETTFAIAVKIAGFTNVILKGGPLNHWWMAGQHQLMILGRAYINYYIWKEGRCPISLMIGRDDEYIERYRKKAIDWWASYVTMDLPPPKGRKLILKMDKEVQE
jgi:predicted phage-related endonuclease